MNYLARTMAGRPKSCPAIAVACTVLVSSSAWAQPPGSSSARYSGQGPVMGPPIGRDSGAAPGAQFSRGIVPMAPPSFAPPAVGYDMGQKHPSFRSTQSSPKSGPSFIGAGRPSSKSSKQAYEGQPYGYSPAGMPGGYYAEYGEPAYRDIPSGNSARPGTTRLPSSGSSREKGSAQAGYPSSSGRNFETYQPAMQRGVPSSQLRRTRGGTQMPGSGNVHKHMKSSADSLKGAIQQHNYGAVNERLDEIRSQSGSLNHRLHNLDLEKRLHVPSISLLYDRGSRLVEEGLSTGEDSKVRMGLEKIEDANKRLGALEKN